MSANEKQVGGDHYNKEGEQHWDRMFRLYGRGYFVGCATKYIERYHLKNGKQDLEKAMHFIQKLIELEYDQPKEKLHTVLSNMTREESYEDVLSHELRCYVNQD